MALYEMTATSFRTIDKKSFADINVGERTDIQRLLRTQIDVWRGRVVSLCRKMYLTAMSLS